MQFNNSREIMTLKCINHKGSHAQVAPESKVRERKGELFFSSSAPPHPHPRLPDGFVAQSRLRLPPEMEMMPIYNIS